MFVHEKKKRAGLILTEDISRKSISVIPKVGVDLILQKSSLSEYSYFHACCSHYFKYDFYKFANTVFK